LSIQAQLIGAITQIIGFSFIPFVWWLITAVKKTNFFIWIGIKKPVIKSKKKIALIFVSTLIIFTMLSVLVDAMLPASTQIASAQFANQGVKALAPALIFAFFRTGLAEEIFFRGFLGKRLISKFGFGVGNTAQAILFGLLHGLTLIQNFGLLKAAVVILFTGSIGWLMGYINEKQAGGSILPSWILHGLANTSSAIMDMFNIAL
jgi:membrane protease YdiL (CAAX protease family)